MSEEKAEKKAEKPVVEKPVKKRGRQVKRTIPPALAEINARRKAERLARVREANARNATEARMAAYREAVGAERLGTAEEISMALEQRMASIPDDNPVKLICQSMGHDPLAELVRLASARGTDRKIKIELNKYLTDKLVPNLKAVDVQQKLKMSVTVKVQSFKDASQKALKEMAEQSSKYVDADYAEFDEGFKEDMD